LRSGILSIIGWLDFQNLFYLNAPLVFVLCAMYPLCFEIKLT
jgi:hypothetical protein